jgi:hypothetical protein
MTDSDDKLLRRYRELPREEPPRALDDAILAASRRAVASRPSSLARRWARPVSIAAVLVLAFGVTLEMQREQPGIEYKEAAPPAPAIAPAPEPAPRVMESDAVTSTAPARQPQPAQRPAPELRKSAPPQALKEKAAPPQEREMARTRNEPQAFPQSPAPPPPPAQTLDKFRDSSVAPAPAAAPAAPAAESSGAPAAAVAPRAKSESYNAAPARTLAAPADPERELERIAKLRDDGRNDEADKALEEFKRRYPGFAIPDATWSRVKPR